MITTRSSLRSSRLRKKAPRDWNTTHEHEPGDDHDFVPVKRHRSDIEIALWIDIHEPWGVSPHLSLLIRYGIVLPSSMSWPSSSRPTGRLVIDLQDICVPLVGMLCAEQQAAFRLFEKKS